MVLTYLEKENIGLILHLDDDEYLKLRSSWEFKLPEGYDFSFEAMLKYRYVAVAVNDEWKVIAEISDWRLSAIESGQRTVIFSKFSERVYLLSLAISKNLKENIWLHNSQKEIVEKSLIDESTLVRPCPLPPSLDFEEASRAVARRYGVSADQVQISIHRLAHGVRTES